MAEQAADPKAALLKYTYPDADKDTAAIDKVEAAIKARFGGSYNEGLANDAPITEDEVKSKKEEAEQKAKAEEASNPDKVKKEATESPPGKLATGAPVKPQVKAPDKAKGGPTEAKKGGAAPEGKKGGGGAGKPSKPGPSTPPKPSPAVVLKAAQSGDANIDKFLDGYEPKSKETTEKLSKIKEMAGVAKGFDGQLEGYVKNGDGAMESAKAGVIDFLGKKDVAAMFGDNPYSKIQGGLGKLMSGLARVNAAFNIVGNICTKLGIVLTIVGLLGMIFPPLGAAVSAVARVLNIIGIVCDVVGLALSGVLVGLNGVVLAKQIAHGSSNEEKAATADLMMSEANSAGGHIVNLAMSFGSNFMKGFKAASKGIIGQLFARAKAFLGKWAGKALGPIANWAKNIGYKLGFGLEKSAGPGMLSKLGGAAKNAWEKPGKWMEALKNTKVVEKINNSGFMKGADKFAAKVNSKTGFMDWMDGSKLGGKLGGAGSGSKWASSLEKAAEEDGKLAAKNAERYAMENAANRERAAIERDIAKNEKLANKELNNATSGPGEKLDQEALKRSDAAVEEAEKLRKGEKQAVSNAEKEAKDDLKKDKFEEKKAEKAEKKAEKTEKDDIAAYNRDPNRFRKDTESMEDALHDSKKTLAGCKQPDTIKRWEKKVAELEKQIEERKMIGVKASGGEGIENWGTVKEKASELGAAFHGKDEKKEKEEERNKAAEEISGHKDNEKFEKNERHEKINAQFEESKGPKPEVFEHVEGMLSELDGEEKDDDEQHDDGEPDAAPGGGVDAAPGGGGNETPDAAPVNGPPANEEKKEPPKEEKKEEAADTGELLYWPKLVGPGGDFAKGAADLARMKQVAIAFHKAQLEAKKKALEAAATFSKSGVVSQQKSDSSKAHTSALNSTIDEAKQSGSAADKGSSSAGNGQKEQDKGNSSSGSAEPSPDPGEKPSVWHPIKRIWWYVKKWASEKAAKVFGWIQEKIASLVLKIICGVSMDDLKAYTTALHHRMEFSKITGTKGVAAANDAISKEEANKKDSKSYEEQALDDAKDCDQNITDAVTFVANIEQTEQELLAEQARAQQFLSDLKAAVDAERARKEAEKQKKLDEAAKTAPNAPPPQGLKPPTPAPTPAQKKKKDPKKDQVDAAASGKVNNAAGYVVNAASLLLQQITNEQQLQNNKLSSSVEKNKKAKSFLKGQKIGDNVVAQTKGVADQVSSAMGGVRGQSFANKPALFGAAKQVKSTAKDLDEAETKAFSSLNFAFKSTYDAIAKLP